MSLFNTTNNYYFNISKKDIKKLTQILINNNQKLDLIMAEQKEFAEALVVLTAQVAKIGEEVSETLGKVDELEAALEAADDVSPEVQAAFDALKAQVQAVDDLVPDAPAEPQA